MRVVIFCKGLRARRPVPDAPTQLEWAGVFAAGLKRHGLAPRLTDDVNTAFDADLAVVWGYRQTMVMNQQRAKGRPFLVLERGYIDRYFHSSAGFNGLNGHATFPPPARHLGDRFCQHLKPMRSPGAPDSVLVCGQVPGDAAIGGLDVRAWGAEMVARAQKRFPAARVVWRPHPQRPVQLPNGVPICNRPLPAALEAADLVVTYNSNVGVDAGLAGVPVVVTGPGSMAEPIAARDLDVYAPDDDARNAWLDRLGAAQWSEDEFKCGTAWEHIKLALP